MKQLWARLLLVLALALGASNAQALCGGVCGCGVSTTNLTFLNVNPLSSGASTSTASVTISCGGVAGLLIPYSIAFSAGNSGSFSNRKLSYGSNTMAYNIYQDPGLTTIWGDGTNNSQMLWGGITLVALGTYSQSYTAYGNIPLPQATTAPGTYTDLISVTVTYY